jgi:hypothetical protein
MTRIIDRDETRGWLASRGLLAENDPLDRLESSKFVEVRSFAVPPYVGTRTALAEALAGFFVKDPEVLLHFNDWGVWHDEDWNLFARFRQALGETAKLIDKPGHLFSADDRADLVSLACLVLYFNWGASIVASSGDLAVEISHDEIGWLYAADEGMVDDEQLAWLDQVLARKGCQ